MIFARDERRISGKDARHLRSGKERTTIYVTVYSNQHENGIFFSLFLQNIPLVVGETCYPIGWSGTSDYSTFRVHSDVTRSARLHLNTHSK